MNDLKLYINLNINLVKLERLNIKLNFLKLELKL